MAVMKDFELYILLTFFSLPFAGTPYDSVAEIELGPGGAVAKVGISVAKSDHCKCPRCWKRVSVSEDQLCARCETIVDQ